MDCCSALVVLEVFYYLKSSLTQTSYYCPRHDHAPVATRRHERLLVCLIHFGQCGAGGRGDVARAYYGYHCEKQREIMAGGAQRGSGMMVPVVSRARRLPIMKWVIDMPMSLHDPSCKYVSSEHIACATSCYQQWLRGCGQRVNSARCYLLDAEEKEQSDQAALRHVHAQQTGCRAVGI